jgi:ribosome biogenesis protein Tsr3
VATVQWRDQVKPLNERAVTTMTADTPAIVFVHGAWADARGFGESIRALRERGFAAIGFANPLRHLAGDAAILSAVEATSRTLP